MSEATAQVPKLKRLGNVHHAAYRCRDAEQTRWFYEDVLGLPLAAAMVFDEIPGSGRKSDYMHLFFELGDGNFIAFFDEPSTATPDHFLKKNPSMYTSPSRWRAERQCLPTRRTSMLQGSVAWDPWITTLWNRSTCTTPTVFR